MAYPDFTLAYCTNIWTHHQAPVSMELVRLLGENHFKLCLFEKVPEEQRALGYDEVVPNHRWICGPPTAGADWEMLMEVVCDADVAVLGACPDEVILARVATGKLTFFMSERLMRKSHFRLRMINPRFARGVRRLRSAVNRQNVHYLAIGHYAVRDAALLGVFDDRIWSWAYFVAQTDEPFQERSSSSVRLLWAGRFLSWKRVDILLQALAMLNTDAGKWSLELIGDGPTRSSVERLTKRLGLGDRVFFRGSMPHVAARRLMTYSDIYVFPSNRQEGWGAVVGEAMSEGCVVVASKSAGASKALIRDGHTGFLFNDGGVSELARILSQVTTDGDLRRKVGRAAALHMHQEWHPHTGAERLVGLCQALINKSTIPKFSDGPCQRLNPWAPYHEEGRLEYPLV